MQQKKKTPASQVDKQIQELKKFSASKVDNQIHTAAEKTLARQVDE